MSLPRFRLVQGKGIGERSTPTSSAGVSTPEPVPQPPTPQHVIKQEIQSGDSYSIGPGSNETIQLNPEPMNIKMEDALSPPQLMVGPSQPQHPMQRPIQQMHPSMQTPQQPMHHVAMQMQQPMQIQQQPMTPMPPHQFQGPMSNGVVQSEDKNVTKCVRFLKTLINLSNNEDPDQPDKAVRVKQLIRGVIYMESTAEEFTRNLQQVLKSQAQPHLLPFLENTLPALRAAVRNGEASVEGISPPPGYVFSNGRAPPPQHPQQQLEMRPNVPVSQGSQQIISRLNAEPHMTPRLPMMQRPQMPMHPPQRPMNGQIQMQLNQQQMQMQHGGPPPIQQQPPHPQPQHQQPHPPQQPPQHMTPAPPMNDAKMEVDEPPRMRQYPEGSLKSAILRPDEILNRITKRMMSSCSVEEEALVAISDAVESHLRELITRMAGIAEHRVESMRVPENYVTLDDVKRQLRFLEDVDRQEEEMRESREKESLIRLSKNKNSGKETIEKAKEMQRQDAEAKRNRDANAAAIAALSSNKTVKNKWEGSAPAAAAPRPRTVRVTTRDLQLLVNTDNRFHGTFIREKLLYGGPATDTTI